jgi:hypothetical protein
LTVCADLFSLPKKESILAKIAFMYIHADKVQQIRGERRPVFSFIEDAATILHNLCDSADTHDIKLTRDEWRDYAAQLKRRWDGL